MKGEVVGSINPKPACCVPKGVGRKTVGAWVYTDYRVHVGFLKTRKNEDVGIVPRQGVPETRTGGTCFGPNWVRSRMGTGPEKLLRKLDWEVYWRGWGERNERYKLRGEATGGLISLHFLFGLM